MAFIRWTLASLQWKAEIPCSFLAPLRQYTSSEKKKLNVYTWYLFFTFYEISNTFGEDIFFEQGCLELLSRSGITVKGKKAVVVGRSNIVGLPVSLLLLKADATVTIVHSHSQDPEKVIREADIIIAAAGQAMMVTRDSL